MNGIKNTDDHLKPMSFEIREELCNLFQEQYDEPATSQMTDKDI